MLIIVLGGRGELWEFYVVVFALTPFINAESFRNSEAQNFGIIEKFEILKVWGKKTTKKTEVLRFRNLKMLKQFGL